ncbi:MAG: cytochrome C oxidase subunit IV family protein [Gemmatimonadetes bacterium]|nr:cytochrome C oxidase subunit IV family protein [Gemmatimonadota bacterium]
MAGHSEGKGLLGNHYVRVYAVLLVLLAISIVGPVVGGALDTQVEVFGRAFSLGIVVTLVTAFGIAVVKAWLVIKNFMHLTIERVIPKLFLAASVLLLALFWGGVAPDVQNHEGRLWENDAAKEAVARGIPSADYGDEEHAGDEYADADEASEVARASLIPTGKTTENLLPGGYNFTHAAFWTVVVLVAIGTNAVAIMLSIGLVLLVLELLSRIPIVRRFTDPMLDLVLRLPGMGRIRGLLPSRQEA